MLNVSIIRAAVNTIAFELELSDKATRFNIGNPATVARFVAEIRETYADEIVENIDLKAALADIDAELARLSASESAITKDDLKTVYVMLKDRQLHPAGEFDKAGRFYLEDAELVDVRAPSAKYPFSQMNAGRTSKFVKAMSEKYKPQTLDQLISLFRKA